MASYFLNRYKSNRHGSTTTTVSNIDLPDQHSRIDGVPRDYYTVDKYAAAVLFEVFLYGIYSTLFAICLRVLLKNKRTRQKMFLGCAMVMFSLATFDVVLELGFLFWFVVKKNEVPDSDLHFKFLIYITSNVIADSLVISRCYSVWNNSKRVIFLPCILLVCGSVCGYAFIGLSKEEYHFRQILIAFLFATVTLNILVTVLMAGRIWWIARKARSILGPGLSSRYNTMIAMVVESGMIYSIYVVLDVVFPNLLLDAGLAQVVGIMPTLIIVQIGLGRNTHDVDTASVVQTDVRTHDYSCYDHDGPPSTSRSYPVLPPLALSSTNPRISRLYEVWPRTDDDECGHPL